GAYRGLIQKHGEPAPGPLATQLRLRLQPAPEILAVLPYYAYHPFGVEQRRADVLRRVARDTTRLEALTALAGSRAEVGAAAATALRRNPGIGAWTAAEVTLRALGDPDAVSVGDFHLKNLVSFALAGEPRGTDDRMLELLEPWARAVARSPRACHQAAGTQRHHRAALRSEVRAAGPARDVSIVRQRTRSASDIAARWAGVEPQQAPMIVAPASRTSRAYSAITDGSAR
ncbi:MAG: hypothetical protein HW391_1319, partial [Chloroflexi bacterium]|nr:hypothetical protein [Chloroflexota bacterium]